MSLSRSFSTSLASLVVVLAALGSLGSCDDDPVVVMTTAEIPFELGQYGSLVNPLEYEGSPATLPPFALSESGERGNLRTAVMLSNLPVAAQQGTAANPGSPGTCEAQSFGYGLGSYTAARLPDGVNKWNPADPANSVSSAFLYAVAVSDRLAGPCPRGGLALQYLQRLIAAGAPNRAQVPYQPSCTFLNNVDPSREWPNEDRFRIGSYSTFKLSPDSLELIKRLLAAGNAIAFTGRVYENYDDPPLDHGVFGSNTNVQPDTIPNSGHGQLLVGYDDTKGDPSAPGAFLIQNSFGPQWPPSEANPDGRIWWAYKTFFDSQKLAATAYPRAESIPQEGKLESTLVRPEGFVTGVHHWVDPRDPSNVYLIVELQFTEPVQLESITITEPTMGTQVQQEYGLPFSTGYVFTRRIDGAQFVHGGWTVGITVEVGDVVGEYMGTIDVGQSVPTAPPPAPAAAPMFGTTGIEAAVLTG